MKVAVIIPAAGVGQRFGRQFDRQGGGVSKIERDLAGKPVFLWSVEAFISRSDVGQVLLAVNPEQIDEFRFRWADKLSFLGVQIVAGGKTERWQTVLEALRAVQSDCTHIGVHDAARPLVSEVLIDRVFEAAARLGAVLPGVAVVNTLKRVTAEPDVEAAPGDPLDAILGDVDAPGADARRIVETVGRTDLVAVQTPQVFEAGLLQRAYEPLGQGKNSGDGITDDAGLVEALGHAVYVVPGEPTNFKITVPADAELAAAWLGQRVAAEAKELAKKRLFADDEDD